jgi:hypothetical protein
MHTILTPRRGVSLASLADETDRSRRLRHLVKMAFFSQQALNFSEGGKDMDLSAPQMVTFIISVIVAVGAVIVHYAQLEIPVIHSHGFLVLLLGYLILVAGNVLSGV